MVKPVNFKLLKYSHSSIPVIKPRMNETWICRLRTGSVTALFNLREYFIEATDENVFFFIEESHLFEMKSASDDALLDVVVIRHECMSYVYNFIGRDANTSLEYRKLISSSKMSPTIKRLFESSFSQLYTVLSDKDTLFEVERMVMHLVVNICLTVYNGIAAEKGGETDCMDNTTQSYRIMSRLFDIFQDSEALKHRDTHYFSNKLNISSRYFYDVCIRETGMTSKQFIDDVIISEMKHRILGSSMTFQQISFIFGFEDQTAFTQYFKRITGLTPTEFRNRFR